MLNRRVLVLWMAGVALGPLVWSLSGQAPGRSVLPFGSMAGGTNTTTITSDTLDFDYRKSVAVFQRNVVVESGSMRMQSDRLTVVFVGTNQLDRIEAEGNVRFQHPQGAGTCRRANYTSQTGRIVLSGDAVLNMRQPTSVNVIRGDPITFLVVNDELHSVKAQHVKMEHKSVPGAAGRRGQ